MGPQFSPLQNRENHKYLLYSIVTMIKLATQIRCKITKREWIFLPQWSVRNRHKRDIG